jgi:proteasome lid subunit RPN8/RPN11
MHLTEEIKNYIIEHSLEHSGEEVCGLIISNNRSLELRAFKCQNISSHPENHFEISPRSYIRASRIGKIIAMYHSHISGTEGFSELDMSVSENHNIKSVLYNIEDGSFDSYEPSNYKSNIWTKKPSSSIYTCFKAIIDFYEEVLSLDVSSNSKELLNLIDQRTFRENVELIDEKKFYKKGGFVGVFDGPINSESEKLLKKYDVIALKYFDITAHLLIYLDNDKVFHHTRDGYPRIEKLTHPMKARTKGVVRHSSFVTAEDDTFPESEFNMVV